MWKKMGSKWNNVKAKCRSRETEALMDMCEGEEDRFECAEVTFTIVVPVCFVRSTYVWYSCFRRASRHSDTRFPLWSLLNACRYSLIS